MELSTQPGSSSGVSDLSSENPRGARQDIASSSSDSWLLSLNMDDLKAECKAKSEDPCVFRVPPFIRNLKPHQYNPIILPMGMYNRDFRTKTPMDELKLQILNVFLVHLHIDHYRWKRICREVAHAESQTSRPGAPRLEHFYQQDGRPSFLTPELELSVLIIDAFFIVAVLIRITNSGPPALIEHIDKIFSRRVLGTLGDAITIDIFCLYENQVPLFLVENLWTKAVEASRTENQSSGFGFNDVISLALQELVSSIRHVPSVPSREGVIKAEYSQCEHLLACWHRALCTGIRPSVDKDFEHRPLMDIDKVTGRFNTELVSAESRVKRRDRTKMLSKCKTLPSATCLRKSGIRFKGMRTHIGDIRFEPSPFSLTATLHLPRMSFHEHSEKLLLNLCAYEYMNPGNEEFHVNNFVYFLDELIDSKEDVDLLMRGNNSVIARSVLADNKELADVFTNLLRNYNFPLDEPFSKIRDELINWYDVGWRRHLIGFLERFAKAPWLLVSLIAATILLVLTLLQTMYTMWAFYKQY